MIFFREVKSSIDVSGALMAFFWNVNKRSWFCIISIKYSVVNVLFVQINLVI